MSTIAKGSDVMKTARDFTPRIHGYEKGLKVRTPIGFSYGGSFLIGICAKSNSIGNSYRLFEIRIQILSNS
jgi:hypothetical protein